MARIFLAAVLVVMINVLSGCHQPDGGASQLLPPEPKVEVIAPSITQASEADIVEHMAANRQAYRNGLLSLTKYYENTGNDMMLAWAKNELSRLDKMPQYNYIIEAAIAGPGLRASASITEADYMYDEALRLEKRAKRFLVIYDENLLRVALSKYNELIKRHPSSDKIDEAAFGAAGICEGFKDYTLALLYYQRTYQWNGATELPAKFKAGYILDRYMLRRAEALEYYRAAVAHPKLSDNYREFAQKRIEEITKADQVIEEPK